MKSRFVGACAAVLFALTPVAVGLAADPTPAPSAPPPAATPNSLPTLPPNTGGLVNDAINALGNLVKPAFGWDANSAHGTVTFYRGYEMQIRMQLNRYRDIHLHRGTRIDPRGWNIELGQIVDIRGRGRADGSIDADVITVRPQ